MRRQPKGPHTHFPRGKRVRIGLRDGTVIVGRFYERIARHIVLADERGQLTKIATNTLRSCSDYQSRVVHGR